MRYASEQFNEKQGEIIRPANRIFFEIGTNTIYSLDALYAPFLDFDDSIAPEIHPASCTNEYYYAVVGDGKPVDDSTRICCPDNRDTMSAPTHSVPFGICPKSNANEEVLIGSDTLYIFNFTGISSPITLSFKGGLIPEQLRVEVWDEVNQDWFTEDTVLNPELSEEIKFTPSNLQRSNVYRRFWVLNSTTSGRYQLNWIREELSELNGIEPVIFDNSRIATISVNEDTDLTSQTLPSYTMTVDCLDVDDIYTPESDYWDNQFTGDTPCYLKVGYQTEGGIEYIPIMCGKLTEKPTYSNHKITFKVAIDWKIGWTINIAPVIDPFVNVGDPCEGETFNFLINSKHLFEDTDIFYGYDDIDNSKLNYRGEIPSQEVRQLVANALGGYIRAGFNTCNLYNSNKIQYRNADDTLIRYGQVNCSYENLPKVGRISITRTENIVSDEYVDVETPDRKTVGALDSPDAIFSFTLPSSDISRIAIVNAQSDTPSAHITINGNVEVVDIKADGTMDIVVPFTSDIEASIKPICRFNKSVSNDIDVAENIIEEGENYTNSNILITNEYITNKVKRTAHLISDMSEKYEVDFVQDLRYEIGDIIRLETQKNVFKDCVITGIKYQFPGSKGHLTLRRVFSLSSSEYAVLNAEGLTVDFGLVELEVTKMGEIGCFVATMNNGADTYIYVLGVDEYKETIGGVEEDKNYNAWLTDLNNHVWHFASYVVSSGTTITTDARIIELPDYDMSTGATPGAYGAIALLKELYRQQKMNAPVDWECSYETDE